MSLPFLLLVGTEQRLKHIASAYRGAQLVCVYCLLTWSCSGYNWRVYLLRPHARARVGWDGHVHSRRWRSRVRGPDTAASWRTTERLCTLVKKKRKLKEYLEGFQSIWRDFQIPGRICPSAFVNFVSSSREQAPLFWRFSRLVGQTSWP